MPQFSKGTGDLGESVTVACRWINWEENNLTTSCNLLHVTVANNLYHATKIISKVILCLSGIVTQSSLELVSRQEHVQTKPKPYTMLALQSVQIFVFLQYYFNRMMQYY